MKIYRGSLAYTLSFDLLQFGNLSYTSLIFYPHSYESVKDTVQRLIREGHVAAIKAKHVKSLYLTPKGVQALREAMERGGEWGDWKHHPVVYNIPKVRRVDLVHEARFLFQQAGLEVDYTDCRTIKQDMERLHPRSSDNLKYSRFAGVLKTGNIGLMVYHCGRTNIRLNQNGESNARQAVHQLLDVGSFQTLILGSGMDTLLGILRYSEWVWSKPEKQRKHLRINYHLSTGDRHTFFLPIIREAPLLARYLRDVEWQKWVRGVHDWYGELEDRKPIGCLDLTGGDLLRLHSYPKGFHRSPVLVICYDWQKAMVEGYLNDIAGEVEIWIQATPTQEILDLWEDKCDALSYKPYRLMPGQPGEGNTSSQPPEDIGEGGDADGR